MPTSRWQRFRTQRNWPIPGPDNAIHGHYELEEQLEDDIETERQRLIGLEQNLRQEEERMLRLENQLITHRRQNGSYRHGPVPIPDIPSAEAQVARERHNMTNTAPGGSGRRQSAIIPRASPIQTTPQRGQTFARIGGGAFRTPPRRRSPQPNARAREEAQRRRSPQQEPHNHSEAQQRVNERRNLQPIDDNSTGSIGEDELRSSPSDLREGARVGTRGTGTAEQNASSLVGQQLQYGSDSDDDRIDHNTFKPTLRF